MEPATSVLARVRARHPVTTLDIGGQGWRLQDTGVRSVLPPLVLLPGALGTGEVFFHVLDALGRDRRIIALTYVALPSAAELARGVANVLDTLRLDRVDLLGTSLGGYVAQVLALSHPERMRRLVLANTFHDPRLQQARWPPAADYARQAPADVLAAARKQLAEGAEPTPAHTELKRLMLELVGPQQAADEVKAMRLAVLTASELPKVPLAPGQVVLIDDSADPVIAAPTREQMRARYAGSRHFDIAGGGHFPANLQPRAYVEAVAAAID